ncbi:FAD-dependent oxidoreductase [Liquorilactobacillus mali]|uniref:FAD-dependent oxidoreductase n=1 Tax=Liquorilactobacillus mali TaxID=1618 RepID=UPI002953BC66|nr:FAD-dependent oxidoreductase [Liquorilactobacillus mali]MDV7758601.1 FAD-dependent oxidoreductase [Liquorilactobacillus mali]
MYETDVVVVGAGASGIGAALTLVDAEQRVVLLEKGEKIGGAGMFGAQGLFAVESKLQKQAGINYSVKDAYQDLVDYAHYRVDLKTVKNIVELSASTIDWLQSHGLETELVNNTQEVHQKNPKTYHQYIDKYAGFSRLIEHFKKHQGILLTEAAGKKILTDDDGKVKGIQILHHGKKEEVLCKAVVVADGGFIGNQQLVREHLKINYENLYSMGERKATGDGLKMLESIGADTNQVHLFENHAASVVSEHDPKWHNDSIFSLTNIPLLWINAAGQRFTNEDICYDFALWGNVTYKTGGFYYYLLDDELVSYLSTNSLNWTDSFERTFKTLEHKPMTYKVGPFSNLKADLAETIEQGVGWTANSITNLAKKISVSGETLKNTLERYNNLIKRGEDTDFYKSKEFMKFSLEHGPFYAIKARSTSLGTLGGVLVNEDFDVLDRKGTIIKGVFAVGNTASTNMFSDSYPTIEGLSCAFAWNSGRIAGKSAIKFVHKA